MIEENQIHKFSNKLLQESVFPHLKAYIQWRRGEKNIKSSDFAPISINLDPITACSYQCTHCIDRWYYDSRQLNINYIKTLVSGWAKKGLKSVIVIGGGEPTLCPHFEELIRFLKNCSLQIGIVSNGSRIDKIGNITDLLYKKDWIRLSLDAGTNETFKKIHRPKFNLTLDKIMEDVKKIRQKKSNFQMGYSFLVIGENKKINGISLVNNIKEISFAAKLAKENGFTYLSVKPFIDPSVPRETTISRKNFHEIREEIKKAKKLEGDKFKVIESVNLLYFYNKNLKKIIIQQPRICHAQFFRLVVTPAGIFQCSLWRGFDNAKIIDTNKKITKEYYRRFHQNRMKMINSFNAKKICKHVTCLYTPFNRYIEELRKNQKKFKELKPVDDFNDYFL